MTPTKESAERARGYLQSIAHFVARAHMSPESRSMADHDLQKVQEFVDAAEKKLPTERAYGDGRKRTAKRVAKRTK